MAVRQCTALAGHPASAGFRRRGPLAHRLRFHGPAAAGPATARGTPAWSPAVSSLRPMGDGGHTASRGGV